MRHPPAFQTEVSAGRAWCRALGLVTGLAMASLLWWAALMQGLPAVLPLFVPMAVAAASLLAAVAAGAWLGRRPSQSLRWDGQAWLLDTAARRGNETRQGELRVLLDLGDWMLLRFSEVPARRGGRNHLALSHTDLQAHWHVMRSTIYSAASLPAEAPTQPAP